MKAILSLLLAPIPSIIWLAFYLRKDTHPEPNRLVVKIFIFGALMVPLAGFFEFLLSLGLEKISILSVIYPGATATSISEFIITRFLGATFLHAITSGIIGYFLAASLFTRPGLRKIFIGGGIIAATILHSVFNYIIILSSSGIKIFDELTRNLYLLILLLTVSVIVSAMFKRVSRYRSIHKV